jgi:pyruvate kinase
MMVIASSLSEELKAAGSRQFALAEQVGPGAGVDGVVSTPVTVADLEALHQRWAHQGDDQLALVLKIETRQAFLNLPRLLLAAMAHPAPLGVMIARGDLAIECGWEAMAEIQEEILHLCAAAHVPCIWATQVLESMVRHGTPTRAEITDAAMGARAEALMLNKGPNLTATVQTLRAILKAMETLLPEHGRHQDQLRSCLAFSQP